MKTKFLLLPLIALASCSKPPEPPAPTPTPIVQATPTPAPKPKLPTTFLPGNTSEPTPVPTGPIRDRVLTRVEALSEGECDTLVLRLQLVPRDEVIDTLSNPKKDLIRYVKKIASDDQLADLEKLLNERKKWPMQ